MEKNFVIDAYLPSVPFKDSELHLLFINDGQDLPKMPFVDVLNNLYNTVPMKPLVCVGIYCTEDRHQEYGAAYRQDYMQRGSRAGLYTKFIFDELLPFLREHYYWKALKSKSFCGFSLGGLSAIDIVWNHANEFDICGVFSGSLWWRRKSYEDGYDDEKDRIMHTQIKKRWLFQMVKILFSKWIVR